MTEPRRFRISLSGAGARLGWHVGILQGYLSDLGWACTEYRGSSGGGLVAVAASCGKLDWTADWLSQMTTRDVYKSSGVWGLWSGYRYSVEPLENNLRQAGVPDWVTQVPVRLSLYDIQLQAPISYTIPVGDPLGKHWDAVMGTMAVPGYFPPTHGGRWVDGGVTEVVPNINLLKVEGDPWVVSVAMPTQLRELPGPPSNIVEVLRAVINGLVAEITRANLRWAVPSPLRVHVLPRPERADALLFDPLVTRSLIAEGRAEVAQWKNNRAAGLALRRRVR